MEKDKKEVKLLSAPKKNSTQESKRETKNERRNPFFESISNRNFIISQIIILTVGLIFAGLMYFFLQRPMLNVSDIQNYIPVTTEPISFNLEISGPENNSVVFDSEVLVNGKTSPNATVFISTENSDQAMTANDKGDFSQTVMLKPGLNTILVNVFEQNGDNKNEQRVIFYSEEKL